MRSLLLLPFLLVPAIPLAQRTRTAVPPTPPQSGQQPLTGIDLDGRYVNDDQGEVDSADIADGSLTGADVSTSSGDVTFGGGATVTALRGIFGQSSSAGGYRATISGGAYNSAAGSWAVVSGGQNNLAGTNASTVGGGANNTANGGSYATVGGGGRNVATGSFNSASTVAGGRFNQALGDNATVPGGILNDALGSTSFAAGLRAKANHNGSFVWGDSANVDKTSSADDQFNVYAEGGARFFAVGQTNPSFVIDSAGRVGVGTASPGKALQVLGEIAMGDGVTAEQDILFQSGAGDWQVGTNNSGNGTASNQFYIYDSTSLVYGLTVQRGTGDVGIGTTAPTQTLSVNGSAGKPGGGSWSTFSDARLKKNVHDLEGALETLLALRGVTFEYKDPEAVHELPGERMGFIAQEVETVLPDWVEEAGEYKTLTIRGFEALAVEALREVVARSEEKDARIAALEARVERLESIEGELAALRETLARGGH